MKKIIIITDSIQIGGAERALVALLKSIDYSLYDVSLLYFYHEQEFYRAAIPSAVRILSPSVKTQLALSSRGYVIDNVKKRDKKIEVCWMIVLRIILGVIDMINRTGYHRRRLFSWRLLGKHVEALDEQYDVAIAFVEKNPVYYMIDKVIADRYIAWQRTDYILTGCNPKKDKEYFDKVNQICVLSEEMKNNFLKVFPQYERNTKVIPNLIDVATIIEKSKNEDIDNIFSSCTCKRIISVGTLRDVKRYDTAINACRILKDKGKQFKWFVIGEGEKREHLNKMVRALDVEDMFIFLGSKMNPYSYIDKADIFVQCSEREGFSTTVFEAKCLHKPIVVSDAPGMSEQIDDGKTGYVFHVGKSNELAAIIGNLLDDWSTAKKFEDALKGFANESEEASKNRLSLFYSLLES